ncbi:MAG TPA: hypothetical protein VNH17_05000 [Streptosporangiaceae bacterium]|nr:hypothetical protein [Streptosporangiaceae bacterium]
MPVQATSIEAYEDIAPTLGRRQQDVLHCITAHGPISNLGISATLGLPINQVTGRTRELVALGLVGEAFRKPDPRTRRRVIWWQAADPKGGEAA